MYKKDFPQFGSTSVIIELRRIHNIFSTRYKVIGHWHADNSDKEEVIRNTEKDAEDLCYILNYEYLAQRIELARENLELKQLADVAGKKAYNYKCISIVFACCLASVLIVGAAILFHL